MASHLNSNDKYSVAERRSSVTSEKNETGKFGTIGSSISAFPEHINPVIKVEKDDALTAGANEGTFGNVSFGEAGDYGSAGP